jgi:hypothetical protein
MAISSLKVVAGHPTVQLDRPKVSAIETCGPAMWHGQETGHNKNRHAVGGVKSAM